MALNRVASTQATEGNFVAAEGVCLADLVASAATRLGYQHDQLGGLFAISAPEVSKCFGPNNPERNRLMKRRLPLAFARELALVMCEATGLAVGGADVEKHALADLLASCAHYIRICQR